MVTRMNRSPCASKPASIGIMVVRIHRVVGLPVIVLGLLGGCKRSTPPIAKIINPVPSAEAAHGEARPAVPKLDTEELKRVVERWCQAQDDSNLTQYRALYAQDFRGVKRVGDHATEMGREEWLHDRQGMSRWTPRVEISDLRFYARGGLVVAEFHQKWVARGFADEGTKELTLRKRDGSWEIVREAMLASRVLSKEERAKAPGQSGHCDSLGERLEQSERDGELWRFADIGGEGGPAKWARVSSWKDAESKTPHGNVWSSATVVSDGKWLLAYTSFFSPSGDSAVFTKQCYRPDGTLARIEDSFRTFATAQGLGQDTRVTVFDEKGNSNGGIRKTYLVESGQQLDPNEMMGSAHSTPTKRISSLPYFTLLPSEVRSKY